MNNLTADDVNWVIPHEANLRIIEAVTKRAGIPLEKVVVNIDHYGNTSAATIPLALWDAESKLKRGIILSLQHSVQVLYMVLLTISGLTMVLLMVNKLR